MAQHEDNPSEATQATPIVEDIPKEEEEIPPVGSSSAEEPSVPSSPPRPTTTDTAQSIATADSIDDLGLGDTTEAILEEDLTLPKSKAVAPERKQELLLLARRDRIAWIQKAALPYKKTSIDAEDPWIGDPSLATLKQSHVGSNVPSALDVLQKLFGESDVSQLGSRVRRVLGDDLQDLTALPNGSQLLKSELRDKSDDDVLLAYQHFLKKLQDPAASAVVQGMRTFCRNFQDITDSKVLVQKIQAFAYSTFLSLQSHVLWRKDDHDWARRSLESFLCMQCRTHIEAVFFDAKAKEKEKRWSEKLSSLQFVSPQHLEISCLASVEELSDLLQEPMQALELVDSFASPYEKLQRVLAVYKAINKALSTALNKNREGGETKLPSADDVLPTLILTILRAQPSRLHLSLKIIEEFVLTEHLRGEAGYAFTNLYGAMQFLADLDLSDAPQSLTISPEEFKSGLKKCQAATEKRLSLVKAPAPVVEKAPVEVPPASLARQLPVEAVRAARLAGESVDLDWALKWYKEQNFETTMIADAEEINGLPNPLRGLPAGFSRNYGFLNSRPESVRMADLGPLLNEYRLLVKTTETLVAERESLAWAERKAQLQAKQLEVYARAKDVDPTLLPSPKSPKSRKSSS